jgi:predicted nucleic acid-binding Zn ribbon protein
MKYEYRCNQCKEHGEFEAEHSINAPPLEICPQCEFEKIPNPLPPTRLISKSSFILNGGCWSKDNYK